MNGLIKLINENVQDLSNIKKTILENRGIKDVNAYLTLGTKNLNDYLLLGKENLDNAAIELSAQTPIYILVDTDVDGYSSAAIMYRYLTECLKKKDVNYVLNHGKVHGLTYETVEFLIEKAKKYSNEVTDPNAEKRCLLIIPDAGTNDSEFCKSLEPYFRIIIIDHHEQDKANDVILINPKANGCEYPNKNLCGAAVVYKFLQYLDDEMMSDDADKFIDLVAVAMIADIMDLRDLESRFLTIKGLMNIDNKFVRAIIEMNSFSISNTDIPNALDIAFYVSPVVNACIRIGTKEEHELLFRAFIEDDRGQTFKYKPRKSKNNPDPVEIDEDFYVHVARICRLLKGRQDRICEKKANEILENTKEIINKNKILVVGLNDFKEELIGVLANKICNLVKRPTMLLKEQDRIDGKRFFSGSARNYNNSYIYDFKSDANKSGFVKNAAGHSSAFGVKIFGDNVASFVEYMNEKYKDIDVEKTYYVDFWLEDYIPYYLVKEIDEMKPLFSNFVEQPMIACDNIIVEASDVQIETAENGNKRFHFLKDDIEYVKFKLPEDDDFLMASYNFFGDEILSFNIVGKTNINLYGGKATPQVIIDDYDVNILSESD